MKLVFSGLETPIDLAPGYASTLQIANETFALWQAQLAVWHWSRIRCGMTGLN